MTVKVDVAPYLTSNYNLEVRVFFQRRFAQHVCDCLSLEELPPDV